MGLFDGILDNVLGSVTRPGGKEQAQDPLGGLLSNLAGGNQALSGNMLSAAMTLLQQKGGLSGVLDMFRKNGMAQQADSWVSTGPNAAISGEQLEKVLGAPALSDMASKLGLAPNQARTAMAKLLPELINQFTPQGQVPENQGDLLSKGLAMLKGVTGGTELAHAGKPLAGPSTLGKKQ